MAKRKKKPKTREEQEKQIEQQELELLQKMYGIEEGEKRYREIQGKVIEDLERDRNETWFEREKRIEQEHIDQWINKYRGMTVTELIGLRDLFEVQVKKAKKSVLYGPKYKQAYKEEKAKLDAVTYLINNPSEIEVKEQKISQMPESANKTDLSNQSNDSKKKKWEGRKKEFASFVVKEYYKNQDKYSSIRDAVYNLFNHYEFKDSTWTEEKCYDLVRKYHSR